ncbi:hypothetical protein TNCV_3927331 [Trichonephila clavipes]|nr:hypothetical protein TNCV_3927331 [Trichonephila clavipes]
MGKRGGNKETQIVFSKRHYFLKPELARLEHKHRSEMFPQTTGCYRREHANPIKDFLLSKGNLINKTVVRNLVTRQAMGMRHIFEDIIGSVIQNVTKRCLVETYGTLEI